MTDLWCLWFIFFSASSCILKVHGDGFKNNLNNPTWGMGGSRLVRISPAHYADGAYAMVSDGRPNPMEVSLAVHMGLSGQPSMFSRNAMQAFFAQMVMDEMVSVTSPGCPPEYENLNIPDGHPLATWTQRPQVYIRSMYDQTSGFTSIVPRQQQNQVSSFLDGGIIYGTSHVWTNLLRSFKDGQLLADDDLNQYNFPAYNDAKLPLVNAPIPKTHDLKPVERLLRIGNPTGHETPFLLALQVVWFRWHNLVAKQIISEAAPAQLSDSEVFEAARKRVTAHFQKIVMTEWFPHFLNGDQNGTSALPTYEGYNRNIHPGISQEFLVAMSFRHTLSPAAVWKLAFDESSQTCRMDTTEGQDGEGNPRNVTSFRLCNNFWDSQELVKSNLDDILRGLVHTLAEKEDEKMVADFTQFFHGPYEYSRKDYVANEIQRFRDHGLPGLNTVLTSFGLPTEDNWDRLKFANGTIRQLYGGDIPGNVDLFTAGLMEGMGSVAGISDIFRKIIIDQFTRIRDGDRSWYQREGMFTPDELTDIETITFRHILMETTSLSDADLPPNVFLCNGNGSVCGCLDPPSIDDPTDPQVDVCTPLKTHDYVKGSEWSFAASFAALALVVPASILVLRLLKYRKTRTKVEVKRRTSSAYRREFPNRFKAKEWLGPESGYRVIKGEMDSAKRRIVIKNSAGKELRYLDMDRSIVCCCSNDCGHRLMVLKTPGDIDLILKFVSHTDRDQLIHQLKRDTSAYGINMEMSLASESELQRNCSHRDDRQRELDSFFRIVSQRVMAGDRMSLRGSRSLDQISAVKKIQLTMTEFADALGLQPSSVFVQNIFLLADRDNDNRISFQEFLDLFAVFLKGTAQEKARLVFDVYDVEGKGEMSEDDFNRMIRSFLELGDNTSTMSNDEINMLVTSLFRQAGKREGSNMDFEHFQSLFCSGHYASVLQAATLPGEASKHALKPPTMQTMTRKRSKRNSFVQSYRLKENGPKQDNGPTLSSSLTLDHSRSNSLVKKMKEPRGKHAQRWHNLSRKLERYRWQIFWMTLYTLVTIGIFVERAYFFAVGREHTGLRRVSGPWVVASIRGSASVIMFTFSSLLVTMCRNTITALRETFLHRFIPFDSAVAFHKYIALLAMIGILIHIVGHAINLYCMSTQTAESLNCFFREYYILSDKLPHFHYWLYHTITGLAGVAVTILIFVMYVFASQYSRRHVFKAFWFTHSLYWLVYVLTFLHGIGRLVQAPLFPWYLVGPLILFVLDRLKSLSRKKVEIAVTSSTALPSGVTRLIFKRPTTFSYRSGQWVRIACLALGDDEYHPFTLTSAPHEPTLSLHIRAVGPWTKALRKIYTNRSDAEEKPPPNLYVDGPFGEGHQDWYTADVAVLVGGGIGVTPFASILKDIAFKSKSGIPLTCKRVYFLWVTKSQKGFEWMVDIVRETEMADIRGIVEAHVFITQFPQKYDLRTTMLYICERHFQKMESRSIFTGLKSVTHFGRPDFEDLFMAIAREFKEVSQIGVFSCGPGPMTSSVQAACSRMNSFIGPTFTHHFENF